MMSFNGKVYKSPPYHSNMKEIMLWNNKKYQMEWFDNTDYSKLKNITQIYGVLFDKSGKICLVRPTIPRGWRFPGGKIEPGENCKQALIREADEEADIEIDNIVPLGYIKVTPLEKDTAEKVHCLLRATGRITKIKKQTLDPAEDLINERIFIDPKDFLKYCPWGKVGNAVVEKAMKINVK
jgi:8-oxo-dGTP pyrophosphatase MutT (NUDIX family)